jgi:hypothetical protein
LESHYKLLYDAIAKENEERLTDHPTMFVSTRSDLQWLERVNLLICWSALDEKILQHITPTAKSASIAVASGGLVCNAPAISSRNWPLFASSYRN